MTQSKSGSEKPAAPKPVTGRRQSGIAFPYYNLAQSIEVARVIYQRAGGQCDRAQLSAMLGYKGVKNGSFLSRVTSAKLFGLIEQEADQVPILRVTDAGKDIVAPVTKESTDRAKVAAFLRVPLYQKVYEEYRNGSELPPMAGLRNLFVSRYQIVPDRARSAAEVMLDSADEAGFFRVAGDRKRLVAPIIPAASSQDGKRNGEPANGEERQERADAGREASDAQNGGELPKIHPAILGLLQNLPPKMSSAKRTALIAAFTATVNWVYPDTEAEGN